MPANETNAAAEEQSGRVERRVMVLRLQKLREALSDITESLNRLNPSLDQRKDIASRSRLGEAEHLVRCVLGDIEAAP